MSAGFTLSMLVSGVPWAGKGRSNRYASRTRSLHCSKFASEWQSVTLGFRAYGFQMTVMCPLDRLKAHS
jgi:hypothetical protein